MAGTAAAASGRSGTPPCLAWRRRCSSHLEGIGVGHRDAQAALAFSMSRAACSSGPDQVFPPPVSAVTWSTWGWSAKSGAAASSIGACSETPCGGSAATRPTPGHRLLHVCCAGEQNRTRHEIGLGIGGPRLSEKRRVLERFGFRACLTASPGTAARRLPEIGRVFRLRRDQLVGMGDHFLDHPPKALDAELAG